VTEMISVVVTDDGDGQKGLFSAVKDASARIVTIDAGQLALNIGAVCDQLAGVLSAARTSGGFELDCFEVTLELTAKGEVRLIGSASSEVRGGVKLQFRRPAE
jgi:hypothetical protein